MSEVKNNKEAGFITMPKIMATVAIVAVVAVTGFTMSKSGVAENVTDGKVLNEMAPASGTPAEQAAQDSPMIKLGDPVVAVVGDEEIKRSDVFAFIGNLPEQVRQMPIQQLFPMALEQVVNNRVISSKAENAALGSDDEVQKLVEQAKNQIVRNVYVDRQIEEAVTQKRLLKAYEELLDTVSDIEEVHARHILVEDEEKAKELIAKLDEGADFETLARENSTGPSAERGGDLGFFAKNEMVPEFSEAAFALDVGSYTKEPVQTQFGWHVVKVEEKRMRPEPKFEDVKAQLEAQERQKALAELLETWQKEAKIKKYDINGEEIKQN